MGRDELLLVLGPEEGAHLRFVVFLGVGFEGVVGCLRWCSTSYTSTYLHLDPNPHYIRTCDPVSTELSSEPVPVFQNLIVRSKVPPPEASSRLLFEVGVLVGLLDGG